MLSMSPSPRNAPSALRYRLAPDPAVTAAIEATFRAYDRMMEILDEVGRTHNVGSNVVLLHAHAYDAIRKETALPSRLVTLGLRDRAEYRASSGKRLPLDDKLAKIKGPATISIATVEGRFSVPFDYAGYAEGWGQSVPARLIRTDDGFEIHYGVTPNILPEEENAMDTIAAAPENFLSRVGRLIAGIAYDAIEQAEGKNKLKVVSQAIREIERAEAEAREALGAARAEEYRLNARRSEIERETADLNAKIQGAVDDSRDDLARAGIARQMDLEAQFEVLTRAIDENNEKIENCVTSLRAVMSALQDAEQRRADLEQSEAAANVQSTSSTRKQGGSAAAAKALRAGRAVARATGVPSAIPFSSDIDELSALHRDKEIAARLARLKSRS
ncbi:PspA/IM30 family protein [Bradyrhizobium manausense]|uniref:PspA/IM30 family protein n=1 Tax=Bradyrhizobium TaxID=374 RepID=UPI001BAABC09|nr:MULTISPECIES: PspA/IM30 family protein [Bradyrhizobium]MBR0829790.1 PspA/IM30 family protein [Bradyrhizobium manausense]UVO25401.1 PspA/IM30 family protein [Bradyrhizobium arachidis]